ncbi:MAG TPA: ATP-binding protein [Thermodesulfobacteriota bacterium]|nr:ATP-binding protein [Thermodesulfobacteriota bacterium]
MSVYAIPAALAFGINLTLCLIVFYDNPKGVVNRVFTLLILSFVAWNAGELIMITSDLHSVALVGVKVIFIGVFLFPVFFLHFSYVFPQKITPLFDGWRSLILYAGPVALLVPFILLLQVDIGRVVQIGSIFYYVFTFHGRLESQLMALILGLIGLGYFTWGVVNFIISYRQTKIARQRLQILYLLVGIISMFVIGLVLHVMNYFFDLGYSFFFVASLYSLLISFFFALAIVKYRLVDIHFIIRGGILYSLLSGLVLVIYVLFIKNVCDILARKLETTSLLVEATMVLVLVFLLRPLERKVEEFIDRFFYRERYFFRLKFFEFTRTLLNLLDLQTLLETTVAFISQALLPDRVGIWILESESNCYRLFSQKGFSRERYFAADSPFIAYLKKSERAVELETVKDFRALQPEVREMSDARLSLVLPLEWEEGLLGFILVGEKKDGKNFTIMEIEALEALAPAVAMAISRARLYQDLKKKDWQMMQSEKLAALGEMAASFVHGIRNPLGIILGSAETLKKKVPQPVQSEMIQFISEESDRINRMLTNFLEFAKPKPPVFQEVDLKEVLDRTLDWISIPARKQRVEVLREYPEEKVLIPVDPEQVREALVNLEMNALEAMPQGGKLRIVLNQKDNRDVTIRLSDTGGGISPELESKIFDPFFTTKQKGTGLGLSIVHSVVKNHGGTISVISNNGEGTTFTLTLPFPKAIMGCFGAVGPVQNSKEQGSGHIPESSARSSERKGRSNE